MDRFKIRTIILAAFIIAAVFIGYVQVKATPLMPSDWDRFHSLAVSAYARGDFSYILHYPPLFYWLMVILGPSHYWEIIFFALAIGTSVLLAMNSLGTKASIFVGLALLTSLAFIDRTAQLGPQSIEMFLLPLTIIAYRYNRKNIVCASLLYMSYAHTIGLLFAFIFLLHSIIAKRPDWIRPLIGVFAWSLPTLYWLFPHGTIAGQADTFFTGNMLAFSNPLFFMLYGSIFLFMTLLPLGAFAALKHKHSKPCQPFYVIWFMAFLPMAFVLPDRWIQYVLFPISMILAPYASEMLVLNLQKPNDIMQNQPPSDTSKAVRPFLFALCAMAAFAILSSPIYAQTTTLVKYFENSKILVTDLPFSSGNVTISNGTANDSQYYAFKIAWANLLNVPTLVNGTNGTNGLNGTNGATGPAGADGVNGTNGTDGTNATIESYACDGTDKFSAFDNATGFVCTADAGSSPFDQSLNTTDNVNFSSISMNNDGYEMSMMPNGFMINDNSLSPPTQVFFGFDSHDEPYFSLLSTEGSVMYLDKHSFTYNGSEVCTAANGLCGGGGNASWNESYYQSIWNATNESYMTSTYNVTYDSKPSSTFNTTYDSKPSSTFNSTYDAKPSNTFNATYDSKVSANASWNETRASAVFATLSVANVSNNSLFCNGFACVGASLGNVSNNSLFFNGLASGSFVQNSLANVSNNTLFCNGLVCGASSSTFNATYDAIPNITFVSNIANYLATTTTWVTLTNLTMNLPASGKCVIECDFGLWTNATTTGYNITFNTTGTSATRGRLTGYTSATAEKLCSVANGNLTCAFADCSGTATSPIRVMLYTTRSGVGTMTPQIKGELAGSLASYNITQGSFCRSTCGALV